MEGQGSEPAGEEAVAAPFADAAPRDGVGAAGGGSGGRAAAGGGGVKFDETPAVGVASSTVKPAAWSFLKSKATGKPPQQPGDARLPPPPARFDSSAMPARPALKSSNSSLASLANSAADSQEEQHQQQTAQHNNHYQQQQQEQEQQQQPAPPRGRDAPSGAEAFLAALGGERAPTSPPEGAGLWAPDYAAGGGEAGPSAAAGIANPLFELSPHARPGGGRPRVSFDAAPHGARDADGAPPPALKDAKPYGGAVAADGDAEPEIDQAFFAAAGASGSGTQPVATAPDRDDAGSVANSAAASSVIIPPGSSAPLPTLSAQLTPRALLAGVVVGCGYALLATRLVLVAGLTPSFQVSMAAGCWAVLKVFTLLLGRDVACVPPLVGQEVAVASAAALACAGSVVAGGFGPALEALSKTAIVGLTGPEAAPGSVTTLGYARGVAWVLLVGVAGGLLFVPMRRQLLARPSMVFPTGAATGHLVNSLHTPGMSYHGHKARSRFVQWGLISFFVSGYEWVFSNPACDGFAKFPTFGLTLAKWRWLFDFSMLQVGVGLMAPLGVAWSLLVGAVLSWGVLWPVLSGRSGTWFPEDAAASDARGLYGYQLAIGLGLMMADGAYCAVRCAVGGVIELAGPRRRRRRRHPSKAAAPPRPSAPRAPRGPGSVASSKASARRRWHAEALAALENDAMSEASNLQFGLSAVERSLRKHIFQSDRMLAASMACLIAAALLLIGAAFALPPLLAPISGVRYWQLIVATAAAAPFAALANARGVGTTDVNLAPAFAAGAVALFSAWGGDGAADGGAAGIAAGIAAGSVVLGTAQSAAHMGFSFAAGLTSLTSPRAVFAAHLIGAAAGALFAPFAYTLLMPALPLSPLAGPARAAAALFSTGGLSALPSYAGWMALAAAVVGGVLAGTRDAMGARARVFIPAPAIMGVAMLAGASVAVAVTLGTILRVVWRWRAPRSADTYAAVVGGALVAGDGLWALGRALLGAFAVAPPICMNFSAAPGSTV
ncbi:metal-nicotianamine transporter-like [Raphidocelis subcapitata]|uniref:Metal-nicotianamine transporter-like n=1 Tax=Raphidocelis subcapitata TaxID=307507 RepID=A0A2V0P1M6_9CHLO|nr:metal-nicotianamine transporter-like [Raphidocelis subcapitata]|eukprot:GBF93781.1 metal-nicotianamine transporter-like [Raphidocelis subcapitata]